MNEVNKKTYLVRRDLESPVRGFVYDEKIDNAYTKHFKYVPEDRRLLSFALDNVSMTSDCYLLYAVAHMGVADKDSISLFLQALSNKYPALNIVYEKTPDAIEGRLRLLAKMGYLFCFRYMKTVVVNGIASDNMISLYTVVAGAYDVVKQRLQKRLNINAAIQYKPIGELIGWASAAYTGACIAISSNHFVDFLERVLRTKQLGAFYFPVELKTVVEEVPYYIAVMSSYLYRDDKIHTETDYAQNCAFKINAIKNYLSCRTQKGVAIVVVTVADNDDLMEISSLIYKSEILKPYLEQIYFTGEGVLKERAGNAAECFLQMRIDYEEEIGYRFEYTPPVFL